MSAFSPVLDGLRPVFVVGHPRSGTTLVQQLLTAHPALWSAPETHLFTHVLAPLDGWQDRPLLPGQLPSVFRRLAGKPRIALSEQVRADILAEAERGRLNAASLLNFVLEAHRTRDKAASRWLEKTPRHVFHLDVILRSFPDARVIHVLRDPRGVASSSTQFQNLQPGSERSVIVLDRSESWNRVVDVTDALAQEPRLITLRYEDIVSDTETALRHMSAHIGVDFDASVLERFSSTYSQVTVSSEAVRKQLNTVNQIVDRRAVYRERMTADEIAIVDTVCRERMQRKGYTPDGSPQPALVAQARTEQRATPKPSRQAPTVPVRLRRIIRSAGRRLKRQLGFGGKA